MIIKELTIDKLKPFIPSGMRVEGRSYQCILYHFIDGMTVRAASLKAGFKPQCGDQAVKKVHENVALAGFKIKDVKVLAKVPRGAAVNRQ